MRGLPKTAAPSPLDVMNQFAAFIRIEVMVSKTLEKEI